MSRFESNPQEQQSGSVVEQAKEKAAEIGQHVRDTAREQFQHIRNAAGEYYEQGREKAMEWEKGLEHVVRNQPIKSILIAAGVGMLLGILWRR